MDFQSSPSGANFVKVSLQSAQKNLDKSKYLSEQLDESITSGLNIVNAVIKIAGFADAGDTALDRLKGPARHLVEDLQGINQNCNMRLGQSGSPPKGPGTPQPPNDTNKSATVGLRVLISFLYSHALIQRLAIENAQYKVLFLISTLQWRLTPSRWMRHERILRRTQNVGSFNICSLPLVHAMHSAGGIHSAARRRSSEDDGYNGRDVADINGEGDRGE